MLLAEFEEQLKNTSVNMKFLVLGKTRASQIRCCSIDYNGGYKVEQVKYDNNSILRFASAYNGEYGDYNSIIEESIIETMKYRDKPIECVVEGLTKTIKTLSSFDDSVNDHISSVVVV